MASNVVDATRDVAKDVSKLALSEAPKFKAATLAIHGDDFLNTEPDVAPSMHLSTTFRYTNDYTKLTPYDDLDQDAVAPDDHIYSRLSAPNTTRYEAILTSLLSGPAISYSSGLSAFHALLTLINPKRISIGAGYHGCHGVIGIFNKLTGLKTIPLDCAAEDLQPGDIIHIETPLNPTGYAYNLKEFADKAHSRGAFLSVDATFAPPPLQDPFKWGADIIMHSGTKYFGGHSDMLSGVLVVNPAVPQAKEWVSTLKHERGFIGSNMGSMEGWLGVRSLRTLEVRLERASKNVSHLVGWLQDALDGKAEGAEVVQKIVKKIEHTSLQKEDLEAGWLKEQMPNGYGPVFSLVMKEMEAAKRLPSYLRLFHHATSLGGVESLIEWRTMSDPTIDRGLLRVSVGIENWEDLRDDLLQAFTKLAAENLGA